MGKKNKAKRVPAVFQKVMTGAKVGMKLATHVLTIGGIILVVSPAARGVSAAFKGDLAGAQDHILYDTTNSGTAGGIAANPAGAIKAVAVNVGVPVGVGLLLIAAGALARRRIGN